MLELRSRILGPMLVTVGLVYMTLSFVGSIYLNDQSLSSFQRGLCLALLVATALSGTVMINVGFFVEALRETLSQERSDPSE